MTKRVINPATAARWLEIPVTNRKIIEARWKVLAHDMAAGEWQEVIAPPIFLEETTGAVLDGQHRLAAIASMPEDFEITADVRKVDREVIDWIDTGYPRRLVDQLAVRGHDHTKHKSAFLNTAASWALTSAPGKAMSRREQVAWLESNPNLESAIGLAVKVHGRPRSDLISLPMGTVATLYDIMEVGGEGEEVSTFIFSWLNGDYQTPWLLNATKVIAAFQQRGSRSSLTPSQFGFLIARVFIGWLEEDIPQKLFARRRALQRLPYWDEWLTERWAPYR